MDEHITLDGELPDLIYQGELPEGWVKGTDIMEEEP